MWLWRKDSQKEDLYTRILLWAYNKQESGFTWDELEDTFKLTRVQRDWVYKVFKTQSDMDRKFFEELRNDTTSQPNKHYESLNEKGMATAITYLSLQSANDSSLRALQFAGISLLVAILTLIVAILSNAALLQGARDLFLAIKVAI